VNGFELSLLALPYLLAAIGIAAVVVAYVWR
jgi:hypothetical protein